MKVRADQTAKGRFTSFVISVWCAFIRENFPDKPDALTADVWINWTSASSAPPYAMWSYWCGELKIPFEKLLLKLATYEPLDDTPEVKRDAFLLRRTVLRNMYGRVNRVYYPLLDTLISRKVAYPKDEVDAPALDLRQHVVELEALRLMKWKKLRHAQKLRNSSLPEGLDDLEIPAHNFKPSEWRDIVLGHSYPKVEKAGYVARALGISYDDMYEIYNFSEITGDNNSLRVQNTMKSLRTRFNKGWGDGLPAKGVAPAIVDAATRERRQAARRATIERRTELLLEGYKLAVARSIQYTQEGDNAAAGYAKREASDYDKQLTDMNIPHASFGPADVPKPVDIPVMKINPVTQQLEAVKPRPRTRHDPAPPAPPAPLAPPAPPPPPIDMPVDNCNSYAAILARHPPPPLPPPSIPADTSYRSAPPPSLTSIMDM